MLFPPRRCGHKACGYLDAFLVLSDWRVMANLLDAVHKISSKG
jgi:hypothetical protein